VEFNRNGRIEHAPGAKFRERCPSFATGSLELSALILSPAFL
jgi:hypothetical protein